MATIHYSKMTKADLEAELARVTAERDKLENRGKVGVAIKLSDKVDENGNRKIVVRVPGQRYPVTVSEASWRMICSKRD